jgi:hypothetical protein
LAIPTSFPAALAAEDFTLHFAGTKKKLPARPSSRSAIRLPFPRFFWKRKNPGSTREIIFPLCPAWCDERHFELCVPNLKTAKRAARKRKDNLTGKNFLRTNRFCDGKGRWPFAVSRFTLKIAIGAVAVYSLQFTVCSQTKTNWLR